MTDDVKKWLEATGEEILRKIGISEGQTVLDFGCGSGNYTIPAAKIVGGEGIVYALDVDERALDELMQRGKVRGLKNIRRMDTSGEIQVGLDDESLDVVLLYDIFWYFPLENEKLTKLLREIFRVSKTGALISVFPKHIDSQKLKSKIAEAGFHLKDKYSGPLLHYGDLEDGEVFNFIKKSRVLCKSTNYNGL